MLITTTLQFKIEFRMDVELRKKDQKLLGTVLDFEKRIKFLLLNLWPN